MRVWYNLFCVVWVRVDRVRVSRKGVLRSAVAVSVYLCAHIS